MAIRRTDDPPARQMPPILEEWAAQSLGPSWAMRALPQRFYPGNDYIPMQGPTWGPVDHPQFFSPGEMQNPVPGSGGPVIADLQGSEGSDTLAGGAKITNNLRGSRTKPVSPALTDAVSRVIEQTYGPGYTAVMRSAAGSSVTGTKRHTPGRAGQPGVAADFQIFAPDGHQLAGAELDPLLKNWVGIEGSVGANRYPGNKGRNFTHLDLIGGIQPYSVPLGRKEDVFWTYDGLDPNSTFNEWDQKQMVASGEIQPAVAPQTAQSALASLTAPSGGTEVSSPPNPLSGFATSIENAGFGTPGQQAITEMLQPPTQLPPQWDPATGFPEQPRRPGPGGALGVDLGQQPAGMPVPPARPGTFDWLGGGAPDAGLVPPPGISPLRPAMGGPGDRRPQPPLPTQRPAFGIPTPPARPANSTPYDTDLTPSEEADFRVWKQVYAPGDTGENYDYRGAFKAGFTPDANGHWPDTYKKPGHPTFSDESIYAAAQPGLAGHWSGEVYIPPSARNGPPYAGGGPTSGQRPPTLGNITDDLRESVRSGKPYTGGGPTGSEPLPPDFDYRFINPHLREAVRVGAPPGPSEMQRLMTRGQLGGTPPVMVTPEEEFARASRITPVMLGGNDFTQMSLDKSAAGTPFPQPPPAPPAQSPAPPSPYDDPSRAFDNVLNYPVSRLAERSAPLPRQDFSLAGPGPTFTPPLPEARMKDDSYFAPPPDFAAASEPAPALGPMMADTYRNAAGGGGRSVSPFYFARTKDDVFSPSSAPAAMAGIEDVFGRTPAPAAVSNLAIPYDQVPGYNPPATARPMPSYPVRAGDTMVFERPGETMAMPISDPHNLVTRMDGVEGRIERQAPMPQGREGDLLAEAYGLPRSPPPAPPPQPIAPPPPVSDPWARAYGTQLAIPANWGDPSSVPISQRLDDAAGPTFVPGVGQSIYNPDEPMDLTKPYTGPQVAAPDGPQAPVVAPPPPPQDPQARSRREGRQGARSNLGPIGRILTAPLAPFIGGRNGGGFIGPNGFFSNAGSFTPSGAGGTSFFNQQPGGAMGTTNWRHGSVTGNPNMQGTMWNRSGDNGSVGYVTDPFNPGTSMIYSGSPNRF